MAEEEEKEFQETPSKELAERILNEVFLEVEEMKETGEITEEDMELGEDSPALKRIGAKLTGKILEALVLEKQAKRKHQEESKGSEE